MPGFDRERLRAIKTFPSLVKYLRDELDWPIETDDFDDLTFEYEPEELGLDPKTAANIKKIKQLRPLTTRQPWGIFFLMFEPKRLPVVALRRILSQLVLKKRASARKADQPSWHLDDLLFISNYGEDEERQITFAHFSQDEEKQDLPTLKVLGWDNQDTPLHLDDVAETLSAKLVWPSDEANTEAWRKTWRSAFTLRHREVITTSRELSVRLADLARAIRNRINAALAIETDRGPLTKLMKGFQEALVHDLDAGGFADMYAQTIAYGLLSARVANPKATTADHLPAQMPVTNPFLKELMETFLQVGGRRGKAGRSGIDFDELGVSEVVQLLDDAKMEAVIRDFGDKNPQEDPVIHFYELFLKEYDAKKRMQRGVFYTPRPVVSYIVRSVDELLRKEFGLEDGLADTTTWGEMAERHTDLKIPEGVDPDQAFVQILDPATGTGTFLVAVIDIIHKTLVAKWEAQGHGGKKTEALWNEYVAEHLLPRLHGYELLMAPYAIAHLKIGLKLCETGYRFGSNERARIYLTNALEPASGTEKQMAFKEWIPALAHEAQAVNEIKRRQGFTVVVGNPPYAQYSMNMNEAAKAHIEKFRYANGKRIRARNALQLERNLNDDYVKFLGLSSALLPPGAGVLGMITNRMYLDSESLVGLREWFVTHFDQIHVLDLWGSNEESRRVARLAADENVFDILQGVAVSFFVRYPLGTGSPHRVTAREVVGQRSDKYKLLAHDLQLGDVAWGETHPSPDMWWMHRIGNSGAESGLEFTLAEVFPKFSTLVASNRDHLVVSHDRDVVLSNVQAVNAFRGSNEKLAEQFGITLKTGWNVAAAREKLRDTRNVAAHIEVIEYRPFDRRWIFFHPTLVWQTAPVVSGNVLGNRPNRVLISLGKNRAETINGHWVSRTLADKSAVSTRDNASGFPLYIYPADKTLRLLDEAVQPNLSAEFLRALAIGLGVAQIGPFGLPQDVTPEDVFNYAYAVLYSPSYRNRYVESLKIDFPRLPLPGSQSMFHSLASLGDNLVAMHLMESPNLNNFITTFAGPKNPEVERIGWADKTVWLNAAETKKSQPAQPGTIGFHGVPQALWDFHIGEYQVCEKWLKDRKGRKLSAEDISHYQKIIVALSETIRLMEEIDEVIEAHGGWPDAFVTDTGALQRGLPVWNPRRER